MAPSKKKEKLTEVLIQDIQAHPAIWNKTSSSYKDAAMRSNAWANIFANLQSVFPEEILIANNLDTIDSIKNHWKNLRDTYTWKKKEIKGKSGTDLDAVVGKKDWPFFEMLMFLNLSETYGKQPQRCSSFIDLHNQSGSGNEEEELDQTESHQTQSESFSFSENEEMENEGNLLLMEICSIVKL